MNRAAPKACSPLLIVILAHLVRQKTRPNKGVSLRLNAANDIKRAGFLEGADTVHRLRNLSRSTTSPMHYGIFIHNHLSHIHTIGEHHEHPSQRNARRTGADCIA